MNKLQWLWKSLAGKLGMAAGCGAALGNLVGSEGQVLSSLALGVTIYFLTAAVMKFVLKD